MKKSGEGNFALYRGDRDHGDMMAVGVASSRSWHLLDSRVGAELPGTAFRFQQRQAPGSALGPGAETADPAGRPRAGFHSGL